MDRCDDAQAARISFVPVLRHHDVSHHFGDVLRGHAELFAKTLEIQILVQRGFILRLIDIAQAKHPLQDIRLSGLSRTGFTIGLNADGALGRPASIAAWASVISFSSLPKYTRAATAKPSARCPR